MEHMREVNFVAVNGHNRALVKIGHEARDLPKPLEGLRKLVHLLTDRGNSSIGSGLDQW
jgi:hypothetical protein